MYTTVTVIQTLIILMTPATAKNWKESEKLTVTRSCQYSDCRTTTTGQPPALITSNMSIFPSEARCSEQVEDTLLVLTFVYRLQGETIPTTILVNLVKSYSPSGNVWMVTADLSQKSLYLPKWH